jgi:hypothetical protein
VSHVVEVAAVHPEPAGRVGPAAAGLDGDHDGHDITEINELNHYIGMKPSDRAALTDLDWIPFALGLLAHPALRGDRQSTARERARPACW